ncbi:hypothetical protein, partial [Chromobacterium violaceum]|uniref:hypothetical protein n=1 Tax=Chromobacterium violaceum TaxID=536 RepID=UPI001C49C788
QDHSLQNRRCRPGSQQKTLKTPQPQCLEPWLRALTSMPGSGAAKRGKKKTLKNTIDSANDNYYHFQKLTQEQAR